MKLVNLRIGRRMATIKKFEDIFSWQKARALNTLVGKHFNMQTCQGNCRFVGQIQGSAGSIMDNIAEGFERGGNKEFVQFLYISKASCGEFRSQLYRALDRGYVSETDFETMYELAKEIIVLLQGLIKYLEQSEMRGAKFRQRRKSGLL